VARPPTLVIEVTAGTAAVVIVKVPATPIVNAVDGALVKSGVPVTLLAIDSVKFCVAGVPTPLFAMIVSGYDPALPGCGVPDNGAVPSPLSLKSTPAGSAPIGEIATIGVPVVVIVNVPRTPITNVVVFALVIVGAPPVGPAMLSVKL